MVLTIDDLSVHYDTKNGALRAVENVNLGLEEGESLGIIGESGCGKTTLAQAILRLLPDNGIVSSGEICFDDEDILPMSEKRFNREVRWKEISYIPQTALDALDPLETIFTHYRRMIKTHQDDSGLRSRAERALRSVGLDQALLDDYPHELSGGQRQRVMIAFAFALNPSLVIADEPTTALDVITQDQVMKMLDQFQDDYGTSLIMITHDISIVIENCDYVAVMYAGDLVEYGRTEAVFNDPKHPYTMGLKNSIPEIDDLDKETIAISGTPPSLTEPVTGCKFRNRCPFAIDECKNELPDIERTDGQSAKCVRADEAIELRAQAGNRDTWLTQSASNN